MDDPVSPIEIAKNNAIYNYQGNRNPYIDHPEYVCNIWSTQCATVNSLSRTDFAALSNISVYPNPSSDHRVNINSEYEIDEIQLISINGQIIQQISNPTLQNSTYSLENIPTGFYFLRLSNGNQSVVKKVIIN